MKNCFILIIIVALGLSQFSHALYITKVKNHHITLRNTVLDGNSVLDSSVNKIAENVDDIFGKEFVSSEQRPLGMPSKLKSVAMNDYAQLRSTFLADSLFVSALGFSLAWYFGSFKDASSFAIGSALGICYSILLGRYVEKIGTSQKNRTVDALRFAPVIILVALYGKFKLYVAIIPELMGFATSYQIATLLQIFNQNLYKSDHKPQS